MAEYPFTHAETYGVFEAFKAKCYWCNIPFGSILDCSVDHVIPESYLEKPDELKALLTEYTLPETFEINSFSNWVPAHFKCNSSKGDRIFTPSPALIKALDDVAKKGKEAQKTAERIAKSKPNAKLLSKIFQWISKGELSPEEGSELQQRLVEFFKTLPASSEDAEPVVLNFAKDVQVTRTASTTTVDVFVGKFVRTPNADADLSITRKEDEYTIRLGFLGKNFFSLAEDGLWEWTGTEFEFDDERKELVFRTKRSPCKDGHIFHLQGPSVYEHAADSMMPSYGIKISLHDGAAIVTEHGGMGLFEGGWNLSGTYLSGYGVKLEPVVDFSGVWAVSNTHPNPDPTWECPNCGSNVWLGVQCRVCGMLSDPND